MGIFDKKQGTSRSNKKEKPKKPKQIKSLITDKEKELVNEILSEEFIEKATSARDIVRKLADNNAEFGFNLSITHFLKIMHAYINPQSYGARIQNKLIKDFNLSKVSAQKDKGDVTNINGKFGEIKVSYKTISNKFNFVQIRPHQNCDFYLLCAIDPSDFVLYPFLITKDNISHLLKIVKAVNCHGVTENKIDRTQEELRVSVEKDSINWNIMTDKYLCLDLKSKLLNL